MNESKIRIPLRISASLKAKLTALAEREHRSLNKEIEFLLEQCVQDVMKVDEIGANGQERKPKKRH
jgi:hypothetical protein